MKDLHTLVLLVVLIKLYKGGSSVHTPMTRCTVYAPQQRIQCNRFDKVFRIRGGGVGIILCRRSQKFDPNLCTCFRDTNPGALSCYKLMTSKGSFPSEKESRGDEKPQESGTLADYLNVTFLEKTGKLGAKKGEDPDESRLLDAAIKSGGLGVDFNGHLKILNEESLTSNLNETDVNRIKGLLTSWNKDRLGGQPGEYDPNKWKKDAKEMTEEDENSERHRVNSTRLRMIFHPEGPYNWTAVTDPQRIRCPRPRLYSKSVDHNFRGVAKRPRVTETSLVRGYICEAHRWVSECEEMWYFSKYYTREIQTTVPEVLACIKAIKDLKSGEPEIPTFPLSLCNWNSKTSQGVIFHTATPVDILLDPFSMTYKSTLFPEKWPCNAHALYCLTSKPWRKWFPDEELTRLSPQLCKTTSWEAFPFFGDVIDLPSKPRDPSSLWTPHVLVENEIFGQKNLNDGCLMDFCGETGVKFPDGEWWLFSVLHGPRGGLKNLTSALSRCKNSSSLHQIAEVFPNLEDSGRRLELTSRERYERCLDVKDKLTAGYFMNPTDLGYIGQHQEGPGTAYRLKRLGTNKTGQLILMESPAVYRVLIHKEDYDEEGFRVWENSNSSWNESGKLSVQFGITSKGLKFEAEWTSLKSEGRWVGVNGILLLKGEKPGTWVISVPDSRQDLEDILSWEHLEGERVVYDERVILTSSDIELDDLGNTLDTEVETKNIFSGIIKWFDSVYSSVSSYIYIIGVLVAVGLGIWILTKAKRFIVRDRSPGNQTSEITIPMNRNRREDQRSYI
ncbi:glycoprotein [Itacaiunas virus]|uniref:Glycoprotein n=1 Tax=Itacaiunas virus TaxID=490111 RepID=A0A0D3R0Z1_9RHAB|nr:glycoprotein [Itacaiunas virus]AJR28283.1 glycoprotein [Itacaiunas virus]